MNGFLNLLKPPGMSSAAVGNVIKRLTGERIGHAGTLDPEAAGVLPVMIGRATRLLDYFSDKEKEYVAQIAFGCATDTQDAQGQATEVSDNIPSRSEIEAILPRFTGEIMQRPPAYSAVKRDGRSLYKLAREGKLVEADPRPAVIHSIVLGEQTAKNAYLLTVCCGRGTYIRTLCHDMGQALHCPAHMRFLLRTRSGFFSIDDAVTLEEFTSAALKGSAEDLLSPVDAPLQSMPRADLPPELFRPALNGVKLPLSAFPVLRNEPVRVYLENEMLGIAIPKDENLVFSVLLTCAVEYDRRHGA